MADTFQPTLRAYVPSDWEDVLALDLQAAEPSLQGASEDVRRRFAARWPEFVRSHYAWTDAGPTAHGSLLRVCKMEGRFAGHLWLTEQVDFFTEERRLFVNSLAVAPAFRRRGIGRFLMDAALSEARRRGLARIALGVDASNRSAVALYESLGYVSRRLSMELSTGALG